jgi:Ca-activated chloride channel family protein
MPKLSRVKQYSVENTRRTQEQIKKVQEEIKMERGKVLTRDDKPSARVRIEYTEVPAKSSEVVVVKPPAPPAARPMDRTIAKLGTQPVSTLDAAAQRKISEGELHRYDQLAIGGKAGRQISHLGYLAEEPAPGRYPMAHGGTRPPNGEDVDAMFFKNYGVNPFVDTEDDHLSTFATDVDTGSYAVVRGYLHDGHLPPEKAVRVEEFVNYFKYEYSAPQEDDFAVYAEAAPWRFGTGRKNSFLLRLGLKAKQISEENRKPAILTFVIDVSGSMNRQNRLGLVKRCLRMLVENLREQDSIGIAVYGSRGRKVMDHKGLDEKAGILAAIESLGACGSTYAEEGIRIGYEMAESAYKQGYINRVILCSDGVANVGKTGADDILEIIKKKAEKGITLSAIGFGMGNYNDVLMEQLGDRGNGHYAYIDTIAEAKRIFEDNLTGTLQVIARDVKVQVDFNPEVVRSYRLIGYENRDVPDDKFRDDKYDGGEVGAGHSVTALYELKLWPDKKGTAATTYVRYKDADTAAVTEFKSSIAVKNFNESLDDSSRGFRLAATVAEFAEILRKSYWAKGATLETVLGRAQKLAGEFKDNADVIELVDLISKAKELMKDVDIKPVELEEHTDVSR